MDPPLKPDSDRHAMQDLRAFSRSMAELQWLLLILVLLYYFIPLQPIDNDDALIGVMVCYAAAVIAFRLLRLFSRQTRRRLVLETCLMIVFITLALWYTGRVESPLLNLYLLVIIACAITLGKVVTLLQVLLIATCYLSLSYASYGRGILGAETFTLLMAKLAPFLLVAYVTSMLAEDILAANRKIAVLSQTDELTGLLNLRAFNLMLDQEIAGVARKPGTFSIVMIDIDGLKGVNDRYGHGAGSRLLQAIAGAIGHCTRSADVLARYGGDEFVILMADIGPADAHSAAERILEAVNGTAITCHGVLIHPTASIGVASFPEGVSRAAEVLDKADLALYNSKHGGRNRITDYHGGLEAVAARA